MKTLVVLIIIVFAGLAICLHVIKRGVGKQKNGSTPAQRKNDVGDDKHDEVD